MRHLNAVWEVARWEFFRYVKLKQQVIGLVIMLAMLLGGTIFGRMGREPRTVELAVVGAEQLPGLPPEAGRFRFERFETAAVPELQRQVEIRERPAVLVLQSGGTGELVARQEPGWRADLERELTAVAQWQRLRTAGIDAERLASLQAPFELQARETAPRAGGAERIAAFLALALTSIGLLSGIGYIFSSVTGEKQNRLSEQVISAIPPQAWIDGKILGLATVSLVAILNTLVAGLLYLLAIRLFWNWSPPLPTRTESPGLLLLALLLIFLGYLFWFAFLTAVAAIMEDPHTSTRNQLIFLPMIPLAVAFLAVRDPMAPWARVLSILPPTSGAVMPARLLVAEVAWWETLLSAILLLGAIWAVRRLAAKVFRLGMLMYGKEPSWAEVRRWLREA